MRKNALILLLLTATLSGVAQTHPSKWSLDFLMGPAFPVGEYGRHSARSAVAGPVQTGGLAELSGTLHLNKTFGITLLANGQFNHGSGILYFNGGDPQYMKVYKDHNWRIARVMTGVVYTIPIYPKQGFSLLIRALGGIQKTKIADFEFDASGAPELLTEPGFSMPWTFSYQFDAGLQWHGRRRLGFIAYAGYNGCRPSKELSEVDTFADGTTGTVAQKYSTPTGSILLRAGIDWRL